MKEQPKQQLQEPISTFRPHEDFAMEEYELRSTHDRFIEEGWTEEMWNNLRAAQCKWPQEQFDVWLAAKKSKYMRTSVD